MARTSYACSLPVAEKNVKNDSYISRFAAGEVEDSELPGDRIHWKGIELLGTMR